MAFWLVAAVVLQLACAACAAKLGRSTAWLQIILLIPVLGALAFCGSEAMRAVAARRPAGARARRSAKSPTPSALGGLGYQAVRAHTLESRRALAEECMRLGRHADARLLFESCLEERDTDDPELVERLQRATALMSTTPRQTGSAD